MHVSSTAQTLGRRNPAGFLFVVAFHIAFVWILNDALGLRLLGPAPPDPIEGRVIDEKPIVVDEPMQPFVSMLTNTTRVAIDPVEIEVPLDAPVDPTDLSEPIAMDPEPGSGPIDSQPARTAVRIDARHPLTQPPYPTSSIRLGEEGNLDIEILVGRDGRVADARVAHSSGYPRLDQAAIAEALRTWRLTPATMGGEPIEMWHRIRVTFRLDQR